MMLGIAYASENITCRRESKSVKLKLSRMLKQLMARRNHLILAVGTSKLDDRIQQQRIQLIKT